MTIIKLRYKPPERARRDVAVAAQFTPGEELEDLSVVARMARDGRLTVASMPAAGPHMLPDTPLLVVSWREREHDGTEYTVVPPGQYLVYSEKYGSLECETSKDLYSWYEEET